MSSAPRSVLRRAALVVAWMLVVTAAPASAQQGSDVITITGGGWGHGVGMPQWGARGMADDGYTYDQILSYFYTGTGLADISTTSPTPPDPLRVGVNQDLTSETFSVLSGTAEICRSGETAGSCSYQMQEGETWSITGDGASCTLRRDGTVVAGPEPCYYSIVWADQPNTKIDFPGLGRTFARGTVFITDGDAGFHVSVELTLEEYVYGIGEVPLTWPAEALKAQAVAARTYGARIAANRAASTVYAGNGGLRYDCDCHLVWTTLDQVYLGWSSRTEGNALYGAAWKAAVDDTAGQVVVYPAGSTKMAETYYFSSSGGATENVTDVWGSDPEQYPYLSTVPDPWSERYASPDCTRSYIRWCETFTVDELAAIFGMDTVTNIFIAATYESGSPSDIRVEGTVGGDPVSQSYTGRQFKTKLGLKGHFVYAIDGFKEAVRLAGEDRYGTAAAVSGWSYPTGASVVYVATGENYPDALAGGAAAAAEGAPVLLVRRDLIPTATKDELTRLAPDTIVILGGEGVVSSGVADQLAAYAPTVERRWGPTRFETAVELSRAAFPEPVSVVYLATGFDFPDAVVAAAAAAEAGAPLLLTHPDVIPTALRDELTRLGPSEIVVVGSPGDIPDWQLTEFGRYAPTVRRLDGGDRYTTAAVLSSDTFAPDVAVAYVAVGDDFPDALAGGAAAGVVAGPVLLVETDTIPAAVADELTRLSPTDVVILGGEGVVSAAVADQLATFAD